MQSSERSVETTNGSPSPRHMGAVRIEIERCVLHRRRFQNGSRICRLELKPVRERGMRRVAILDSGQFQTVQVLSICDGYPLRRDHDLARDGACH